MNGNPRQGVSFDMSSINTERKRLACEVQARFTVPSRNIYAKLIKVNGTTQWFLNRTSISLYTGNEAGISAPYLYADRMLIRTLSAPILPSIAFS